MEGKRFDRGSGMTSRSFALNAFFSGSFVFKGAWYALPLCITQTLLIVKITAARTAASAAAAFLWFVAEFHRRLLLLAIPSRF